MQANPKWRKSSHSGGTGNCVEVAGVHHVIVVRDSKNPTGPTVALTRAAWRTFTDVVKHKQQDGT